MKFARFLIPVLVFSGASHLRSQAPDPLVEKDFQIEKIQANTFEKNPDGAYLVDFGRAAFATLELNYRPKNPEKLTIRVGEKLLDGRIDRNPGGSIRYQEVRLNTSPDREQYLIELKADERNTNSRAVALPDSFPVLMPFRYCEIEGAGGKLEEEQVKQVAYFYHFDDAASSFSSSDSILNQVWDLCKYSIKATSFAGYYVDGDRERIPYEADAYLNQLSHYTVDAEYSLARRTIEYFMDFPTWPTEWQLHVALMFYQDYWYTGNTDLIEKHYEELKHKTLMALEMENGLISTTSSKHNGLLMAQLGFADTTERLRDIVDWPPAQKDTGWKLATEEGERDGFVFTPYNTVINSLYYQNMLIMSQFAELLGKQEDAAMFSGKAKRVKTAINALLFYEEGGYYRDGIGTNHGSVHANMMPLAFDLVAEKRISGVVQHVKTRGMACSVYGAQYLLEGLYQAEEEDYALELMTATHDRSWYNMIRVGSTISMEAWDMKYKPNADWNHAWGAAPANIIPRWLWGIRPGSPGYKEVHIQPQMGTLQSSSIKVPTLLGAIQASYRQSEEGLITYILDLPDPMTGTFQLKLQPGQVVFHNGREVEKPGAIISLLPGTHKIEIKTSAGP